MKKWANLFLSNFLGVFNDNFLKNAIIFVAIAWKLPAWMTQSQLISIVSASLVLPYILLSPYAGKLTLKYSKHSIFIFFKLLEIPIMLLASIAFLFNWVALAIVAIFLMGIQSCLYSPAKYGLIRDIGGKDGSAFGSGVFESMAFSGILFGTVAASFISDYGNNYVFIGLFLLVAIAGYIATLKIKVSEVSNEADDLNQFGVNPLTFLLRTYKFAKLHQGLNEAVYGVSAFWLIGAMLQMNIIIHTTGHLHLSNTNAGLVMALTAIGIGIGTWLSGLLLKKVNELVLKVFGLLMMIFTMLCIIFMNPGFLFFAVLIFLTAMGGGFYQIPNLTFIQKSDAGHNLGVVLAYMNLCIFLFVLVGTLLFSLITYLTDENSLAVFGTIVCIALVVTFLNFRQTFSLNKNNC